MIWFRTKPAADDRDDRDERIANLEAENDALVESARVMQEHHHTAAQAQQARIDGLNDIIKGLNKALAMGRQQLDKSQAEVKRLDGLLVATQVDLGREREDGRAFRQKWARHLNACPTAEEIHEEDIAKARTR